MLKVIKLPEVANRTILIAVAAAAIVLVLGFLIVSIYAPKEMPTGTEDTKGTGNNGKSVSGSPTNTPATTPAATQQASQQFDEKAAEQELDMLLSQMESSEENLEKELETQ